MIDSLPGLDGLPAPPRDVARQLGGTLEFAAGHVRQFERHHAYWAAHRRNVPSTPVRWLVESVDLAFHAVRSGPPDEDVAGAAGALVDAAVPWVHRGLADLLRRQPQTALAGLGGAQVQLSLLGRPEPSLDERIRRVVTMRPVELVERLPSKAMRQAWLRTLLGEAGPEAIEALLPHSVLVSDAEPLHMGRRDVYHLTHGVWFLTDYGLRPLPDALDGQRLAAVVDATLAWLLVERDWDLVAELLMCSSALRRPWSPYARLAWAALRDERAQDPMPAGPAGQDPPPMGLEATERAEGWFWHSHHAIHVFGKLCALLRRHPARAAGASSWSPPRLGGLTSLAERCHRGLAGALRHCADSSRLAAATTVPISGSLASIGLDIPTEAGSVGLTVAARASGLVPGEIERVLVDASLIAEARSYDLFRLATRLSAAFATVSPASPTMVWAADFLLDQQEADGAFVGGQSGQTSTARLTSEIAGALAAALPRLRAAAS